MKEEPAAVRIFLLSPANLGGKRAKILLNPQAKFPAAQRVREGLASLGETFAFLSGLYFRGKLVYANTYARPPIGMGGSWVITSNRGLLEADTTVSIPFLDSLAQTPIDPKNTSYRNPLTESARRLQSQIPPDSEIVLLGSIATDKYADPLLEVFGDKLMFPADFIGRGDMSRGALMLRSAASLVELPYSPLRNAVRRGKRSAPGGRVSNREDDARSA